MVKKVIMLVILSAFAISAFGQGWGWQGGLGTTQADTLWSYGHGIAVDGDGKVWYASYYNSPETVMVDTGSGTADDEQATKAIYIFNADGTPASFSPIQTLTVDSVTDTLWDTIKGLRTDNNGNVVVGSWFTYYRINSSTGEGMDKLVTPDSSSVTAPAFTDDGEMVIGNVFPSFGVDIYDDAWDFLDEAVSDDLTPGYSRTIEVAKDGSAIYRTSYSSGWGFVRWNSNSGDIYGLFDTSDSLAQGLAVESVAWQPETGYLWGGNTGGFPWINCAHYAFDTANDFAVVDSILMPQADVDLGIRPRGIDFSLDGMTAYLTFFNSWENDAIYKFVKGSSGVWEHEGTFITGYALKANYPNPFNPSTKLDVVLKDDGVADLRIYDMRGAEVAVLNSSYLSAGEHTFTFNAADFPAGVYIAKFTANGAMYSQTMTLVK